MIYNCDFQIVNQSFGMDPLKGIGTAFDGIVKVNYLLIK